MNTFINYAGILILSFLIFSCKSDKSAPATISHSTEVKKSDIVKPKKEKRESFNPQSLKSTATLSGNIKNIDVDSSIIHWKGTKIGGSHQGTIALKSGKVSVENDKITGGEFIIDMKSLSCTDLEEDKRTKLENHLKGLDSNNKDDFFNVRKYPIGKFVINRLIELRNGKNANYLVYGSLTLKDVTKEVGFKAQIHINNGVITIKTPAFSIDRTQWGIDYKSPSLAETIKEEMINDKIFLEIDINVKN